MAASADPNKISPKVTASALAGLGMTLLGTVIVAIAEFSGTITSDQLPGIGLWAIPLAQLINTAGQALAGWWKTDPLRLDAVATEQAMAALRAEIAASGKSAGHQTTVVG